MPSSDSSQDSSQPEHEIVHEKNLPALMRDGTTLYANVTRPAAGGPYPGLVERTPYGKEGGSENTVGSPEFFARRGYAVVIQDVRGRFASEGDFYPFRDDGAGVNRDGFDTIQWTADQDWCDGKVGMIGGSYSGATQYRAMLSRPPNLRATYVRESSADYSREWAYRDGAFELDFNSGWAHTLTSGDLEHLVTAAELESRRSVLARVKEEKTQWDSRLPLYPCSWIEGLGDWHNDWLAHPESGPYWWEFNIEPYHHEIETPVCHLGGWFDIFLAGTLKNYTGMKLRNRTEKARSRQKLIVGPWNHGPGSIANQVIGEFDFGPDASQDFNELRLPWFDHWLKGSGNGVMDEPPVRLFVMGVNRWRDEADWPLPDTRYANWYLHSGPSGAIDSLNDGVLSPETPAATAGPDSFLYDPYDPTPTLGGNCLGLPAGVFDLRPIDTRCLTYTSAPLSEPLEATGPVRAVLFALSSARDTDWVVRLEDIHPDGYSRQVCDGILRARYHESFERPELLEAGKVYRFEVDLWATSNVFLPGHRLRVAVSSSNFPRYDRNLNTGGPIHREAVGQTAVNTVFHDVLRPSHVILPLVERGEGR